MTHQTLSSSNGTDWCNTTPRHFSGFTHCYVTKSGYVPALPVGGKGKRKKPEGILDGADALGLRSYGRIARAAKLVGVLAGERPVRGTCPVAPVVIPGGGKGDQSVESPGVKVPVGWVKTWSAPTGGRANRQVVARANRGQAPKISPPRESEGGGRRKCRDRERWSKASVVGKGTGCMQPTNFPWSQRATCR